MIQNSAYFFMFESEDNKKRIHYKHGVKYEGVGVDGIVRMVAEGIDYGLPTILPGFFSESEKINKEYIKDKYINTFKYLDVDWSKHKVYVGNEITDVPFSDVVAFSKVFIKAIISYGDINRRHVHFEVAVTNSNDRIDEENTTKLLDRLLEIKYNELSGAEMDQLSCHEFIEQWEYEEFYEVNNNEININELQLPKQVQISLKMHDINTLNDLLQHQIDELAKLENIGPKHAIEIYEALEKYYKNQQ